ncbi:C-C motif chemokine 4 homolog isoform X2 [Coturnix japonica]|uniref:C-C motif chemokine 4 homolog isoform X2 n=1 Tax=Coturnix japonica TaxID=93934 RepID=UPI000777BA54|nr:C-C motif chemokine 4 homolog isoform X2 [Coturnix japonica]
MKSSTAAIAVLTVAVLCFQVSSTTPVGSFGRCCYQFLNKALPRNKVMMYEYTGSKCPYHGVIFTTFEGKMCCARPEEQWVQDILNVGKHKDGIK